MEERKDAGDEKHERMPDLAIVPPEPADNPREAPRRPAPPSPMSMSMSESNIAQGAPPPSPSMDELMRGSAENDVTATALASFDDDDDEEEAAKA